MQITKYEPGQFCWVELSTKDGQGAKKFYGELFGWQFDEIPMPDSPPYIMAKLAGGVLGAIFENPQIPPNWLSYVNVDSVDDSASKAKSLGANLLHPPMDVMDVGRMSVVADPEGAVFALWQARNHIGSSVWGENGAACWNELTARNGDAERNFYSSLFGWTPKVSPEYTEWHDGDKARGGFFEMKDARFDGVSAFWNVYFMVQSVDESFARAKSLGATAHSEPMDIPNVGRFAVLGDPQGAGFSLFTPKM